ncbi:hypothetical protein HYH37_09405 [Clostridium botulinum]|uniref:hypothetical protein n=1 Tax=Clostridium botulinum TaxID=1491 RepID=UPI001C9B4034|nr:hypothetical protein [Clostridium botulinum]MBY6873397.1 hypothetical protein [Clostridium botulinum]
MKVIEDFNNNEKDQNDLYDNLKKIKDNIQIIEVNIDKGLIYIPIWYNINAHIKYFDEYEKFEDYRKAFCGLIFSMVEDNVPQINQLIDDININDIYKIDDKYLIKVLKLVIDQSDDLTDYYNENFTGNYFEDFYNSINYEKNKCMKKIQESFKIPKSLESIINSVSKITIPTYVTKNLQQVNKLSEQIGDAYENITNIIKPIQFQHQNIINNLAKISSDMAKKFDDIANSINAIKFPEKVKEINTELLKFGWYTFGEFSIDDINQLYNIIEEYKTDNDVNKYKENVNKVMNSFIDNESEELIKKILNTFPERYKIIEDAYNAHKRGLYTLSIPVILTQADGICEEILGVSLYSKPRGKDEPKTKNSLENLLKENNIEVGKDSCIYSILYYPLEILSCLVVKIKDIDRKYDSNEIYSKFNRHAIIHGIDTRYNNRTNSNKCIAILYYLCDLKKEIDENKDS